ncbi:MAG: hypothetical protein AB2807_07150, partial [Candidatus Sedimenticola endophacoides]
MEEAVSLLAAGHFFHWIKLCTYELNSGELNSGHDDHNDSTACRMRYLYALRHSLSVVTAAI